MDDKYNPFRNMSGIEDPAYFCNRVRELRRLLDNTENQISCSIVGGRKIGKTSLVKHGMRLMDKDLNHINRPWIYLHSEWFVDSTKSEFYRLLLRQIARKATTEAINMLDWESTLQSPEIIAAEVDTRLNELIPLGIQPVIIIDEFESTLKNPHFDYGFYGVLRSFSPKLTYVTITEKTLDCLSYARASTATSPFFNIFVVIPVELFSQQDAHELLLRLSSMGQQRPFSTQEIESLITLAGHHPFFLQRAGFYLFQKVASETKSDNVYSGDVETEFYQDVKHHYQFYWDNLDDAQHPLLKSIAEMEIVAKSSLSSLQRSWAIELAQQALLVEDAAGNYQIVSRALRRFINEVE